jgi:glucuronoarabinoxylan endo-1,4-beta-xylanase
MRHISLLILLLLSGCKKDSQQPPVKEPVKVTVTVDKTVKYQTIDGFGFFGAYDVWWATGSLWNDTWGDKIISDLGITIWRNEWVPPSIPGAAQDADWKKQEPVVQGLKAKADHYGVNLKFIISVWSPPADMKWLCDFSWAGDTGAIRFPGTVSTKNGGTLDPGKYTEYANWMDSCIRAYKSAGVDLYALSLQNEPLFVEPYNSCTYTTYWYCDLLNNVVPVIKSSFPDIKIFGAENMLEMEGKSENYLWFYHQAIKDNGNAKSNIDILAVHGYSDGVSPTSGSQLAMMWTNHAMQFSTPMNKAAWMTETSGYSDTWSRSGSTPGALNLAMDIYSGLSYGNMQAWIWWQGSEASGISNYSIMSNNNCGKKYYASKHFYRYIRPGAVRVKCTSDDPDIYVLAFEHLVNGTNTVVIINAADEAKSVSVLGAGLSDAFTIYQTTSGSDNCSMKGTVIPGPDNRFEIQPLGIITLQAGGDPL